MKTCCAGHSTVEFSVARCPCCEAIDRLDKQLLKADVEIEQLKAQITKLTNEKVSNVNAVDEKLRRAEIEAEVRKAMSNELFNRWNGGAC